MPLTCMILVGVSVSQARQAAHSGLSFVNLTHRVMVELSSGVRIALARLYAFPPARLVLVVWVIFLMLDPQPFSLINKGSFLTLRQQAAQGY